MSHLFFDALITQISAQELVRMVKNEDDKTYCINIFADDMIQQILKDAPEDMDEQLAAYKACSTNPEGIAEAERLYAHYSKLKKGAPAADFDFYDKKGKRYTLKDLRGKAVYIDCWATWCGPCRMVGPVIQELADQYEGQAIIGKVNIEEDADDLVAQFGIRNIPTIIYMKNGEVVDKVVGAAPKATLEAKLKAIL